MVRLILHVLFSSYLLVLCLTWNKLFMISINFSFTYYFWHAQDGMKLLNTWLEGERSIKFCKFLGYNTAKLKPSEIPHCKNFLRTYYKENV